MKVLMTVDAIGGVWTYALELMRSLARDGVTFEVATMGAALSSEQRGQMRVLPNVELHESTFLLEWMTDPWEEVERAGEWLLDLEAKTNPDIVHLNGYAHGALPWRARPLIVAHSCVISWWQAVKREPPPARLHEYHARVRAGLNGAALVLAPTRAMLAAIRRNYAPAGELRIVPNARNSQLFHVGTKEPIIASAGRIWDEAKNIQALARVAPQLSWPVYIAGDGGNFEEHASAGSGNLHVMGVLPECDVAAVLARASIYALPARYEPFGLSVLEAGCSGCALLLGDIESLRENWDGAARFVDPYDDDAIRRGLAELMGDEPRRLELSRRAAVRARRFSLPRMAAAYLNTYIELSLKLSVRGQTCAS